MKGNYEEFPGTLDSTIRKAREWIDDVVKGQGGYCPACGRPAKWYRARISYGNVIFLCALLEEQRKGNTDKEGFVLLSGDTSPGVSLGLGKSYTRPKYFGLMEPRPKSPESKGEYKSGWWRVTPKGTLFLSGELRIPHHLWLYQDCIKAVSTEEVSVKECLGQKFHVTDIWDRFDWYKDFYKGIE